MKPRPRRFAWNNFSRRDSAHARNYTLAHKCMPVMRRWSGRRALPGEVKERLIRASCSSRPLSFRSISSARGRTPRSHDEEAIWSLWRREKRWDSQAPWPPCGLSYRRNGSLRTHAEQIPPSVVARDGGAVRRGTTRCDACTHLHEQSRMRITKFMPRGNRNKRKQRCHFMLTFARPGIAVNKL